MTTRIKGGENVTRAIEAKLKTGWAARAAVINADWADDIVVAAPATELFLRGRVDTLPTCPACFTMEGPTTFEEEGAHNLLSTTEVLVYVFDEDFTGPRLASRLQRQCRAVLETVYDDAPQEQATSVGPFAAEPANAIYRVRPLRTIPGTVFQPQSGESWRAFYIVVFRASQDEGPS